MYLAICLKSVFGLGFDRERQAFTSGVVLFARLAALTILARVLGIVFGGKPWVSGRSRAALVCSHVFPKYMEREGFTTSSKKRTQNRRAGARLV